LPGTLPHYARRLGAASARARGAAAHHGRADPRSAVRVLPSEPQDSHPPHQPHRPPARAARRALAPIPTAWLNLSCALVRMDGSFRRYERQFVV